VAQLGARLDGIEEVVGSNPIGSTRISPMASYVYILQSQRKKKNNCAGYPLAGFHPRR
jgi:hypothetical protein